MKYTSFPFGLKKWIRPYTVTNGELPMRYASVFTTEEVAGRLRRSENTTLGEDHLTYEHWRRVDPEGTFLAATFNMCMHHRRVPDSWGRSQTVLMHKGAESDPSNWRALALGRTIAEL